MLHTILLAAFLFQSERDNDLCDRVAYHGRGSDAGTEAESIVRAQPESGRAKLFRGCLFLADDRIDQATAEFEQAVRTDDRNSVAHLWLGRAYGVQAARASKLRLPGLARKTKNDIDRALELDPTSVSARQYLVEYYLNAPKLFGGGEDRARGQIEPMRKQNPYVAALTSAYIADRQKDIARAEKEYKAVMTQYPDSAEPVRGLMYVYLRWKRYPQAWQFADELERKNPDEPTVRYLVGRLASESGQQLERGAKALDQYMGYHPKASEPSLASAHLRLGVIKERQGDKAGAKQEFQRALDIKGAVPEARAGLKRLK
jgi:Tfp pilus assembly protein PilF